MYKKPHITMEIKENIKPVHQLNPVIKNIGWEKGPKTVVLAIQPEEIPIEGFGGYLHDLIEQLEEIRKIAVKLQ